MDTLIHLLRDLLAGTLTRVLLRLLVRLGIYWSEPPAVPIVVEAHTMTVEVLTHMANRLIYPNTGGMAVAALVQAGMALSKLRLFKTDLTVTKDTTSAELVAVEADYDGYTAITVTAYKNPYLDPSGGASTDSGEQIFYWVHNVDDVGNAIYGFWAELAAGTVVVIGKFVDDNGMSAPISMTGPGDAVPLTLRLIYGASAP